MRPFKFRAWNKVCKVMVSKNEDGGWGNFEGTYINSVEIVNELLSDTDYIWMEYTGIKDKNAKEICEGDIVNTPTNVAYIREVVFHEAALVFRPLTGYSLCSGNSPIMEVLGNIFENPGLLEECGSFDSNMDEAEYYYDKILGPELASLGRVGRYFEKLKVKED